MSLIFSPLCIDGSYLVASQPHVDTRGSFQRTFCSTTFAQHNLPSTFCQSNIATNHLSGVLRGLHLQRHPYAEGKLIRCLSGSIFDVFVDLRPGSDTFLRLQTITLSSSDNKQIYIPPGCAHGYQTLEPSSSIHYLTTQSYSPTHELTLLWSDSSLKIPWPLSVTDVSLKDQNGLEIDTLLKVLHDHDS